MNEDDDDKITMPRRRAMVTTRVEGSSEGKVPSAPRHTVSQVLAQPLDLLDAPEKRYCVIERIGRGGMGEVNRTFDAKIGREIAQKTMLPMHDSAVAIARARFLR
jgi:hypothetical protein